MKLRPAFAILGERETEIISAAKKNKTLELPNMI